MGSSNAYIWEPTTTATDYQATGIDMDVVTRWHDGGAPDPEKHWGAPTLLGKVQTAGQIAVTPYAGYLDAEAQDPMYYQMSLGREVLDRIGRGQLMKLRLTHSTYNEPVELYGIEVPYNIFGTR